MMAGVIQVPSGAHGAGRDHLREGGVEGHAEASLAYAPGEPAGDMEALGREDGAGVGRPPEGIDAIVGPGEEAGAVGGHDGRGGEVAAGGDEPAEGRAAGVGKAEAGWGQGWGGSRVWTASDTSGGAGMVP